VWFKECADVVQNLDFAFTPYSVSFIATFFCWFISLLMCRWCQKSTNGYWLINGEMCFLHRSQNQNTLLTWLWGENFFLIHYLNVRVCLIRMHTFRHFCEHNKYFMCAMRRVLLSHNNAFLCSWYVCVFILSVFCNSYTPVKWQAWRNREFASSFVLSLRNHILRLVNFLKMPFIMTPWAEYEPLSGSYVSQVTQLQLILNTQVTHC